MPFGTYATGTAFFVVDVFLIMKEQRANAEVKQFEKLFEQYKEPFMSFANSYVRDPIVAEDIYVESMMQYWEKRTELPTDINVPAYILTSVKNRALNYLRHLGVRTEAEAQLYEHQTRELNFRISSLESCDPSELFTTEVRDIIRNTLKELPEQTRLIFVKSRFENKTNREIAEELDTHIKTIEYHIAKALKLFRVRLKDYLPLLAFLGLSF